MKKIVLIALFITISVGHIVAQTAVGKWMVFNGTTNYITVADDNALDIDAGEAYTITCKIRTSQWKNMPVFRKRDASNIGYEMTVGSNGNYAVNFRSTTNVNAGPAATVAADYMSTNTWYHLAVVVNPATNIIGIYINGVLKQSQTTTTPNALSTLSFANAVDVTIGHSAAQSRYFLGEMDDIRVWSKAFTEAELVSDMSAIVNNTTPNLIAAWDFENVTGNSVPDVSGNGHTGTINGTVTLPVQFLTFDAKLFGGNTVAIDWSTATETNNQYFEVERSEDGKKYTSVQKVDGALNSNTIKKYQIIDSSPNNGTNYYRLKQIDLDGKFTYYEKIVTVRVLSGKTELRAYPNPAAEYVFVDVSPNAKLSFFDTQGNKIKLAYHQENNRIRVDVSSLSTGIYLLVADGVTHKVKIN